MNQLNRAKQTWVVANWKMNPVASTQVTALMQALHQNLPKKTNHTHVVLAPSFLHLNQVIDFVNNSELPIVVSAQNVCANHAETGAFTGEISALMLKDLGVKTVIIGHSERRQYYGETDDVLMQKLNCALQADLQVIFCIGESLEQYHAKQTLDVLKQQLQSLAVVNLPPNDAGLPKILVAYEPIWAIGTGLTPTIDEITQVHDFIDKTLTELGLNMPILYGGSVNDKNADDLAKIPLVSGVLVGGASLKAQSFCQIVDAF
ncbi:triosephosphate isomerase [Moraxella macacae 0408225]|uniref:Triosephosphate isomerase n=1 Tax=Moraxella macacae 0408225 TaxID=1230338 RepID=L2F709_9GAMM|nr:triose-phosphate isomerase [Moraxella macacae]ELA08869.1 triosephosphate isomerase [Moraxella macacae 0408225]